MGKAGIVNIERETKMSGKIHEKAIFIIASYLGSKVCRAKADQPLGIDHLRAALRDDRGRQRHLRGDVCPPLEHLRRAAETELRRHRLHGPERRCPAHRRGEPEDRRLFRPLQAPGPRREPRGDHPADGT